MPRYSSQFGEAVQRVMGSLSPNQASYKTGLSQEYVRRMKLGLVPLRETVEKFAKGLGVDVWPLLIAAGYEEPTDLRELVRRAIKRGEPEISETTLDLAADAVEQVLKRRKREEGGGTGH